MKRGKKKVILKDGGKYAFNFPLVIFKYVGNCLPPRYYERKDRMNLNLIAPTQCLEHPEDNRASPHFMHIDQAP